MTRASSYPCKMLCPSFGMRPDGGTIDVREDYTEMGNAIHALAYQYVASMVVRDDVAPVAEQFGVDPVELEAVYERALGVIDRALEGIPTPVAETRIESCGRSGHPDVYGITDSAIIVPDWKSGWVTEPERYYDQTACYLWILREMYGRRPRYIGRICNLRTGAISEQRMTDDDLDIWVDRADRADRDAGRVYSPGEACRYCPLRFTCEPRQRWLGAGVSALAEQPNDAYDLDAVARLWPRYEAAKRAVADFDKAIRTLLADVGEIDLGDGTALQLVEGTRDKIDPAKAWPILVQHGLDAEQIGSAMTLAKTRLLDVYSQQYARGLKGKAKAKLTDALREAGAVEVTITQTPKRVKTGEKQ